MLGDPMKENTEILESEAAEKALRQMMEKWPSSVVARSELYKFSGGLIAPGTAANHDSAGTGIPGAFKISRKVAYPVEGVIDWLISRLVGGGHD